MTPKLYKAGEVCDLVQVQLYVLRSWEKEFPGIGIQKSPESPRFYRQSDLEHVKRIKQLVFGEGLTVSGARRRLDETMPAASGVSASEAAEVLDTLSSDARTRIVRVRDGLRELRLLLSGAPGSSNGNGRARGSDAGADLQIGRRAAAERPSAERPSAERPNGRSATERSAVEADLKVGLRSGMKAEGTGRQREFVLKPPPEKPARAKPRPAAARSKIVKRGAVAKASSTRKKTQVTKRKRTHG